MFGVYIHIPFCKRMCGYCDFHKRITNANVDDYAETLRTEMRERQGEAQGQLSTIYFGGGTPTTMSPKALQSIINEARLLWDCSVLSEITIEGNPDDLSDSYLARLAETDCNRLSIGIQSFRDEELRLMNRRHTAGEARESIHRARGAGFANISIDLIYGMTGTNSSTWEYNVREAIALGVEHISAYHLSVEAGTAFAKRGIGVVAEEMSAAQFELLHELLANAGYEHYEISNFALPARRSAHNCSYWDGTPYIGIGEGAHSYDGARIRRANSITNYKLQITNCEQETLTDEQLYAEVVMLALRTADGLNVGRLCERLGVEWQERFEHAAKKFVERGELVLRGERYIIPYRHWLIPDTIIGKLIYY